MTSRCRPHTSDVTVGVVVVVAALVLTRHEAKGLEPASERLEQAKKALTFVEKIASSGGNCSGGTANVLPLTFNTSAWVRYTDAAMRTANFLSQILAYHNNSLVSLPDTLLFDLVRNNVHGRTLIFGSAIAMEEDIMIKRRKFCPYAAKSIRFGAADVKAFDLAQFYDYTTNDTEWYAQVRAKDFSQVEVVGDVVNTTEGSFSRRQPVANYSHGRWTYPYFDCGGGDIWMVTYSAPILALDTAGIPTFKGVATIDLELTNIDINQCDAEGGDATGSLDVFRGTHNCQNTTKCVPLPNQGFTRGSYQCVCLKGFYFPHSGTSLQAFRGTEIDAYFSTPENEHSHDVFRCLPCQRGCESCVDATPCLYEYNVAIRVFVVIVVVLLIVGCLLLSAITFKYRKDLVMKTASPIFLEMMIMGAVLMCASVFLMFPEPTELLCTIFLWPFHLGFMLLYSSLILKTWRISIIFNSRIKVNLTDRRLLQRLLPMMLGMTGYLACWTALGPPRVDTVTMDDQKKFFSCSFDYWNYAVFGLEAVLLLFGVYLCFTVRKAPAHFNESKHITWSTYNAIILGIFIITLTQFLSQSSGPDVVYLLLMTQLQVFVTITLSLIFIPKIWALYKGTSGIEGSPGPATTAGPVSVTGRLKASIRSGTATGTLASVDVKHAAVQVSQEDLQPPALCKPEAVASNGGNAVPSASLHRLNRVSPAQVADSEAVTAVEELAEAGQH